MIKGINIASTNKSFSMNEQDKRTLMSKPCIFLSHLTIDKSVAIKIGDYIKNAGINIYLDIEDKNLQRAVEEENDVTITEFIQKGIMSSTHIMCVLSSRTRESWWVPFEIGYGKKAEREIATIPIKNLSKSDIPSYIRITRQLTGIKSLNSYLHEIIRKYSAVELKMFSSYDNTSYEKSGDASIITESQNWHPLKDTFNQV